MIKLFLLIGIITFIVPKIFADCVYDDHNYYDHHDINNCGAIERFAYTNMALTGTYLYEHIKKYPGQTYAVVTLPIFCMVGHLAHFAEEKYYKKYMRFLNMRDKNEIRQVLSYAVRQINYYSDTTSQLTFKVYKDRSKVYTNSFKNVFVDICGGDWGSLNYEIPTEALGTLNDWFTAQSPYPPQTVNDTDLFNDIQGVLYTASMDFVSSFDHVANPNAIILSDFYVSANETVKFPFLDGIGLFKYAEIVDLDAKVITFHLKGGKHFGILISPNKLENIEELMRRIQDPKVFLSAVTRGEWMCLKAHIVVGRAFMSNKLSEFIPNLQLNTTNFYNVFQRGGPAHAIDMIEQLHLIADEEVREGPVNSMLCPSLNVPSVTIDHACGFYVFDSNWLNVYAGVLLGP